MTAKNINHTFFILGGIAFASSLIVTTPAFAQNANVQGTEQGEFRMFPDVPPGHWAYQAVADLKRRGILLGYPADNHSGEPKVTEGKPKAAKPSNRAVLGKTTHKAAFRKA